MKKRNISKFAKNSNKSIGAQFMASPSNSVWRNVLLIAAHSIPCHVFGCIALDYPVSIMVANYNNNNNDNILIVQQRFGLHTTWRWQRVDCIARYCCCCYCFDVCCWDFHRRHCYEYLCTNRNCSTLKRIWCKQSENPFHSIRMNCFGFL